MAKTMLEQFHELKEKHPNAILLFRCGDFYETYEDDAKECAKTLGITLTKRQDDKTAMAGFPYHALDTYLPRLIRAGKRVAICDQLEDPKLTKRLVKRGITELVSPATNDNQNSKNQTTMATKNMAKNETKNVQAAAQVTDEIESVSVGEVTLDSIMPTMTVSEPEPAEEKAVTMPLGQHGTLVIGGVPKREEKPVTLKRKQTEPEPVTTLSRVRLVTYTTKRGEKAPRIMGFKGEDDPRWKPINDEKVKAVEAYNKARKKDSKAKMQSCPFGPAWLTDRETGEKRYCMTFGVKYMDVAQALCDAYNTNDRDAWHRAEQAVRDTKAGIVSGYQAEKAARRAEREAAKAAKAQADVKPATATAYSADDVAAMLRRLLAGEDIPEEIKQRMAA